MEKTDPEKEVMSPTEMEQELAKTPVNVTDDVDQEQSYPEPGASCSNSTLKRNPKCDLTKTDLLRLLAQYEGELQARDIVIATLKSERVKQYLNHSRSHGGSTSRSPLDALQRDTFAVNYADKMDLQALSSPQWNSVENIVTQYKKAEQKFTKVLSDIDARHKKEMEYQKLNSKRYEERCGRLTSLLEAEKTRCKHIILYLLAERKKILLRYIEEKKRSVDLSQILSDEKARFDAMAEGLEEESKKSLKMEAELEKQSSQFLTDAQKLRHELAKEKKRGDDLEAELGKCKSTLTMLERQLQTYTKNIAAVPTVHYHVAGPPVEAAPSVPIMAAVNVTGSVPSMMTSVAKVIQPTATVSSVPVSTPLTGIAKSLSPGRYVVYTPSVLPASQQHAVNAVKLTETPQTQVPVSPIHYANVGFVPSTFHPADKETGSVRPNSPKISTPNSSRSEQPQQTATIMPGGVRRQLPIAIGRGVPPPVPPNKPVVPPKKEGILPKKQDGSSDSPADTKHVAVVRPTSSLVSDRSATDKQVANTKANQVKVELSSTTCVSGVASSTTTASIVTTFSVSTGTLTTTVATVVENHK